MILGLRHAVEPLDPENQRALGAAVKARKSWAMAYCGMAAALSVALMLLGLWCRC